MSDLLTLARARQKRRAQLSAAARLAAARLWRRLDSRRLTQSWDSALARDLTLVVSAAQAHSAEGATAYTAAVLAAQGFDSAPAGETVAGALSGVASDGRPLTSLLYQSVLRTQSLMGEGLGSNAALDAGLRQLQMVVDTQVVDAGRVADGVATVSDRRSRGYVRVLTPPSCARCAILAGKVYASERAFLRHPRCDCIHVPVGDYETGRSLTFNTKDYFRSLSSQEQSRIFTVAGAQAIREGADIAQVVNARRGMYSAGDLLFTREGMSRRGLAGHRLHRDRAGRSAAPTRLMPETIYRIASDRDEIIALLRRFGYLS